MSTGSITGLVILGYILIIVIGAIVISRIYQQKSLSEFFMAGKNVGVIGTALSGMATYRSATTILGHGGLGYMFGLKATWAAIGCNVVEMLMFFFVARKIKQLTDESNSESMFDYLEWKLKDKNKIVRKVGAITVVVVLVAYVASNLLGLQLTLTSILNVNLVYGILIAGGIVIVYTTIAGYRAVIWGDIIQGSIMVGAMLFFPAYVITKLGGSSGVIQTLQAVGPELVSPIPGDSATWIWAIGMFFVAVGPLGALQGYQRFISMKDANDAYKTALLFTICNIIFSWGSTILGMLARAVFPTPDLLPTGSVEASYFGLVLHYCSPVLAGLLIAVVCAATLSTIDSLLILASQAFVYDFLGKGFGLLKRLSNVSQVWLGRGIVVLLTGLSVISALYIEGGVLYFGWLGWIGMGAAFGPPIFLSFFWKPLTAQGSVAGIVTGCLTTIIWKMTPVLQNALHEGIPAIFLATLAVVVVSLLTNRKQLSSALSD